MLNAFLSDFFSALDFLGNFSLHESADVLQGDLSHFNQERFVGADVCDPEPIAPLENFVFVSLDLVNFDIRQVDVLMTRIPPFFDKRILAALV